MTRKIGDRRNKPRFEIVGDLWGSVEATMSMTLRNLGRGGALLESPLPLAPESVHWVTAVTDGQPHSLQMRVCHSTAAQVEGKGLRYLIGVEFLKLSAGVEEFILRQVGYSNGSIPMEA